MANRAGGVVDLTNEAPNPVGVESITARSERMISRYYSDAGDHCQGFVARQSAFTLVTDEPIGNVRFAAYGDAQILMVAHADGSVRCEVSTSNPVITGRDWEPGVYRVFVGVSERNQRFSYDVTFEDLDRPATVPWADDQDIPTINLEDTFAEPGVAAVDTDHRRFKRRSDRHGEHDCVEGDQEFAHWPSMRILVPSRTTADIVGLSDETLALSLVGPLPEDRRDIPSECLTSRTVGKELEAGEYFLRVGVAEDADPEFVHLVVRDSGALASLTFLATEPSGNLDEEDRALIHHFPFVTAEAVMESYEVAGEVLRAAPAELFLALSETASIDPIGLPEPLDPEAESPYRHGDPVFESLQPGEVVLLIDDTHVLALDGLMARVDIADLVPAEIASQRFIPDAPRNTDLTLDEAFTLIGEERPDDLQTFQNLADDYQTCADYEVEEAQPRLERLSGDRYEQAVAELEEQVYEICEGERLELARDELWAAAEEHLFTLRDGPLQETRQRLQDSW